MFYLPGVGGLENFDQDLELKSEGVAHSWLGFIGEHSLGSAFGNAVVAFVHISSQLDNLGQEILELDKATDELVLAFGEDIKKDILLRISILVHETIHLLKYLRYIPVYAS